MAFRIGLPVILVGIFSCVASAEDGLSGHFTLGEDDISQCVILKLADPTSVVDFAAEELQKHLHLITGHKAGLPHLWLAAEPSFKPVRGRARRSSIDRRPDAIQTLRGQSLAPPHEDGQPRRVSCFFARLHEVVG
jgi:hypothetical protein